MALSEDNIGQVEISGLFPSTAYSIFCATKSVFSGLWMDDETIRQTSTSATTACCIPVTLSLSSVVFYKDSFPSVLASTSLVNAEQFNSLRGEDVQFELLLTYVESIYIECIVSPRYIALSSLLEGGGTTIRSLMSGCAIGNYTFAGKVISDDENAESKYEIILPQHGSTFQVESSETPLP